MTDKKDDISEDELDQIIQDMSKEEDAPTPAPAPVAAAVAAPAKAPVLEVVQTKKKVVEASTQQALTLEMNGVINLKLNFKNGDRSIEVICGEEALICRMADGTEFKIPTGISKARKAA